MSFDAEFFSRQLALDGFGVNAQRRLARGTALVVGLGGTGSVAAANLALAGVGHLNVVDRDVVSFENLHRQPIYTRSDIGMSKAEVASAFLLERMPDIKIDYFAESLDAGNADSLSEGTDVILDCLDNMGARLALNRASVRAGVPLVHIGSIGWDASVAVFRGPQTACLECLFPDSGPEELQTCETAGALGSVTSYAASLGSLEATRLLAGLSSPLLGKMLVYDGRTGVSHTVGIGKRKDCDACGPSATPRAAPGVTELCGGNEFFISRALTPASFRRLKNRLDGRAEVRGESVLVVTAGTHEFSIFTSGGVLVKGAKSSSDAKSAFEQLSG